MRPDYVSQNPAARELLGLIERRGEAKARRADLLTVFSERGLPVTAAERARIQECKDFEQLPTWYRRAITAGSVSEALAVARKSKGAPRRDTRQSPPRARRARPKAGARASR